LENLFGFVRYNPKEKRPPPPRLDFDEPPKKIQKLNAEPLSDQKQPPALEIKEE